MPSQWLYAVSIGQVAGDAEILEVELDKQKFLVKFLAARKFTMDNNIKDGRFIIQHDAGMPTAAENLSTLKIMWQKVRERKMLLEVLLREVPSFHSEILHLLNWLSNMHCVLVASKPYGGLPETASKLLEKFMKVSNEIEANRPKVEAVLQQGQDYIKKQKKPNPVSEFHRIMRDLKTGWDIVTARATEKKMKLETALILATEFHNLLQAFNDFLIRAEKALTMVKPSIIMEILLTQIEDHKLFQKELSTHRKTMERLYRKASLLKSFSQEQDVILINKSLESVQLFWEKVHSMAAKRATDLDHGLKEAKKYNNMWNNLMIWLNDTEQQLDQLNSEMTVNDPEFIKQRLKKKLEFQKSLSAKEPAAYELIMNTGKNLKVKALKNMISQMKSKWNTVCSKAFDSVHDEKHNHSQDDETGPSSNPDQQTIK